MVSEISGGVDIEYRKIDSPFHYKITPYTFSPKIGKKLVNNPYTDIGQGLLQLMEEVYKDINGGKQC
jgi:UDP-glucose 4-epimerase